MIAAFHRAIKAICLLLLTPVAVLLADCSGAVGNGAAQLTAPRGNASSWGNQRSVVPHLRGMVRPGTRPSWMKMIGDAELAAGRIYVGQEFAKTIGEYRAFNPRNGAPVCETPPVTSPEGMTTDAAGTLYTTALFRGAKAGVATFGRNCGEAGPTFNDPDGEPDDPVVDGDTLYLTNLVDTGQTAATINVYKIGGGSSPIGKLSAASVQVGIGVAVDSHHNLFWSNLTGYTTGGQVIEFFGGAKTREGVVIISIGSDFPGGVLLDHADNLLLIDQNRNAIYVYAQPYSAPPFSTIPLKGTAVFCAMGLQQRRLYCLDYEFGSVDVYAYPSGTYIYSYTDGINVEDEPTGVAIQP
jgi:hypothetical protein